MTREPATYSTSESITVHFPGVGTKTIQFTNPNFVKVQEALQNKEYDTLLDLMDPIRTITKWGNGNLTVVNNLVLIDGQPVSSPSLSNKIIELWEAGIPIDPYVAFNNNLKEVRSHRIHTQLLTYLERHSFPLFNDGAFLAYKVLMKNPYLDLVNEVEDIDNLVRMAYGYSPQNPYTKVNGRYLSDFNYYKELLLSKPYVDIHSKSVPQDVGDTVSMDARYVNDNPTEGCSTGLHVGANGYTSDFYRDYPRLLVKVLPMNCISVPLDSNFQKIRVEEYTIVEVDTEKVEYSHPAYLKVQSNDKEYDEEGYDSDGYDREGLDREGYDVNGYDDDGYDREGYGPEDDDDDE